MKLIIVSIGAGVEEALLKRYYLGLSAYLISNRTKTLIKALIDLGVIGLAFINKSFTKKYYFLYYILRKL